MAVPAVPALAEARHGLALSFLEFGLVSVWSGGGSG